MFYDGLAIYIYLYDLFETFCILFVIAIVCGYGFKITHRDGVR